MENNEASEDFVSNYAVEEDLIKKAIEHLADIERREHIFNNQCKVNQQEKHEKPYDKYDWQLVIDGNLKKLTVLELDQYLNYHKLPKTGRKSDKVKRIIFHISRSVETLPLVTSKQGQTAKPEKD